MSEPLAYIASGALVECSEGVAIQPFITNPRGITVWGIEAANESDKIPICNIPSFVMCLKTNTPCVPVFHLEPLPTPEPNPGVPTGTTTTIPTSFGEIQSPSSQATGTSFNMSPVVTPPANPSPTTTPVPTTTPSGGSAPGPVATPTPVPVPTTTPVATPSSPPTTIPSPPTGTTIPEPTRTPVPEMPAAPSNGSDFVYTGPGSSYGTGGTSLSALSPCSVPPSKVWENTGEEYADVGGLPPILFRSCANCLVGGKITFLTTGQIPMSELDPTGELQEEINEINAQAEEMREEFAEAEAAVGGAGLVEGFVPIWGSSRDATDSFQRGKWGWGIFHSAMVLVDVFTLGIGSIVKGAIRGTAKSALKKLGTSFVTKVATLGAAKVALKETLQLGFKEAVERVTRLAGIRITTACFPAGTPVATGEGLKDIEKIAPGDLVWSFDRDSNKTQLKEVVQVHQSFTDSTITIRIDDETIESTPNHRFFTNSGWKEAETLELGDQIRLKSGSWGKINSTNIFAKKKKVFNFTVKDWHTYFVGTLAWLVHNVCIAQAARRGEQWALNILRGNRFNRTQNAAFQAAARTRGVNYFSEVWLKQGGALFSRVDGYIPGKAIIERKATDLAEVTITTAKRYLNEMASKYKPGMEIANPARGTTLQGQRFLQVQNMTGVSQEVLDHADTLGITIVESVDEVFMHIRP